VAVAGTPNKINLPTTTGSAGQVLQTNGANPQQLSWATPSSTIALSSITAATGSNTIANGNNPQTWNWALTTDAIDGMAFGETAAATNGTLTNGLANQAIVSMSTATNSTATPLEVAQGSITNTVATPIAQFEATWNNAGLTGAGIVLNVTNTASAAGSLLENLQVGNVSQWKVDKAGNVTAIGQINCGLAGTTSCIISGAGSTSGTATLTWPAVAGTTTNPVISSNYFQIGVAGTTSGELLLAGSTSGTATMLAPAVAGTSTNAIQISNTIQLPSGTVYQWNADTGLSRDSAAVVDIGNGTAGDKSGTLNFTAATCGVAGTTSCIFSMAGSTSGTATFTAPAVAGTRTNPVISSNYFQIGVAGTTSGELLLAGATSGTATMLAPAVAGTTTNAITFSNIITTPALVTGVSNTLLGQGALASVSGTTDTAVGFNALNANVGGNANTAVGNTALGVNVSGNSNVAVGDHALAAATGNNSVAIGYQALTVVVGSASNTAVGYQALTSATGASNTFIGESGAGTQITTGTLNTLVGYRNSVSGAGDTNEMVFGEQVTGAGSNTGVFGNASTTDVYFGSTTPKTNIRVNGMYVVNTLLIRSTAPTISSGFGTSPSIPNNNGSAAFTVNVGTGGTASSGVIAMPQAATGWACHVAPNAAPQAASVTYSAPTSASSITLTNYTLTTGIALAWTASTVLQVACFGY
jgi:hypothetical protein